MPAYGGMLGRFAGAFARLRGGATLGSMALDDLGFGGSALRDQVQNETDEERKKRMQQAQEKALMGPYGTLGTYSLFGGNGGANRSQLF